MCKTILMVMILALSSSTFAATQEGTSQMSADTRTPVGASKSNVIPTVGLGSAVIKMSGANQLKQTTSVSVAGLVEFGSGALTLQTGLGLNLLGAGVKDQEDFGRKITDARINLSYVNIPVIGKYNFSGSQSKTLFIKAGLMPGYLFHKEVTYKENDNKKSTKNISGIKNFDLPAVVGLGAAFPLQNGYGLVFDLSWIRSLQSIANDGNAYNESFMLSGGFNIPFQ